MKTNKHLLSLFIIFLVQINSINSSLNPGDRFGKNLDATTLKDESLKDQSPNLIGFDNRTLGYAQQTTGNILNAIILKDGKILSM